MLGREALGARGKQPPLLPQHHRNAPLELWEQGSACRFGYVLAKRLAPSRVTLLGCGKPSVMSGLPEGPAPLQAPLQGRGRASSSRALPSPLLGLAVPWEPGQGLHRRGLEQAKAFWH